MCAGTKAIDLLLCSTYSSGNGRAQHFNAHSTPRCHQHTGRAAHPYMMQCKACIRQRTWTCQVAQYMHYAPSVLPIFGVHAGSLRLTLPFLTESCPKLRMLHWVPRVCDAVVHSTG